jgi:phosphate transport system substrate-binding protein
MSKSVADDSLGIGYSNVNYIYSNTTNRPKDGIAVVPLDLNENGTIDPEENFYQTRDDVVNAELNDTIPSPPSRLVYLVTMDSFTGITKDFVMWILTDNNIPLIMDMLHYQVIYAMNNYKYLRVNKRWRNDYYRFSSS